MPEAKSVYSSRRAIVLPASLMLSLLVPSLVQAQLQVATLRGTVRDVRQQPITSALIVLQDVTGREVRSGTTAGDGSFHIADVAPGAYTIRVQLRGATVLTQPLVVRGSLPIELILQAGLVLHDEVVVRGDGGPNTVEHPLSLAGDVVRESPEPLPSQRLQGALAGLPGWTAEDNGLLHVRGVDDGFLYVQDGIPIYERADRLFGLAPNPSGIASVHVIDGYIPPEFGLKSGGVIEVRSETGVRDGWSGTLDAGAADFDTRHANVLAAGPVRASNGLMLTASSERSSRFLDPVDPANLHNAGHASAAGVQWTWRPRLDVMTTSLQGGESFYDVPHSDEQERAGQHQRQRIGQWRVSASWQRVLSERTVSQVSAYRRQGGATLYGSPGDTPVTSDGERADRRYGVLWSLTHQRQRHTLKTGGEISALALDERFRFAVTDAESGREAGLSEAAIAHDAAGPFVFADRRRPALWSGYVQDVLRPSSRLTLNFGVRFDRSRMLVKASQWSPRLGAAYQIGATTVARVSFMRLFQPPQAEYLLLASSAEARALSPFAIDPDAGGSSLPPERQTAWDASISHELRDGWQIEAGAWRRDVGDVADPNVFFGTTVTVPNTVARQDAWGFEVRVDMKPAGGWSGSGSYTHGHAVQYGPITGGLFLEDEYLEIRDGTRFTPDHDQRHAASVRASYHDTRRHWRLSAMFRYQTGTPAGIDEDVESFERRRGSEVVDLQSGRVRPRAILDVQAAWTFYRARGVRLSLTAWVNNVTSQTYAFNFGNPFSGTHFGPPRRAGVSLTSRFGRQ